MDGLRGVAALTVIMRHAPAFIGFNPQPLRGPASAALPAAPFFESYLAVDFFFALSGFVLSYAYGVRLRRDLPVPRFMILRLIRLYPLYILALGTVTVIALFKVAAGDRSPWTLAIDVLFAMLFVPTPASELLFPLNQPTWSLFFELVANWAFGLLAQLHDIALLALVAAAGALLAVAVATQTLGFGTTGAGAMNDGLVWKSFGAGVLRVAYSFFAGVLVHRVWSRHRPVIVVPALFVVGVLLAILFAYPSEPLQRPYDLFATLVAFPLLIWLGAGCKVQGYQAAVFEWLGSISYAIYVLHVPIYYITLIPFVVVGLEHFGFPNWISCILYLFVTIAVASMFDRIYDRPIRARLNARLRRIA